jgi:hypothetical protein
MRIIKITEKTENRMKRTCSLHEEIINAYKIEMEIKTERIAHLKDESLDESMVVK